MSDLQQHSPRIRRSAYLVDVRSIVLQTIDIEPKVSDGLPRRRHSMIMLRAHPHQVDMREAFSHRKLVPADIVFGATPADAVARYAACFTEQATARGRNARLASRGIPKYDVSQLDSVAPRTAPQPIPSMYVLAHGITEDFVVLMRALQHLLPVSDAAVPLDCLLRIVHSGARQDELFFCRSSLNMHTAIEACAAAFIDARQRARRRRPTSAVAAAAAASPTKAGADDADASNGSDNGGSGLSVAQLGQLLRALVERGCPLQTHDINEMPAGGALHMLFAAGEIDMAAELLSAFREQCKRAAADPTAAPGYYRRSLDADAAVVDMLFGDIAGTLRTGGLVLYDSAAVPVAMAHGALSRVEQSAALWALVDACSPAAAASPGQHQQQHELGVLARAFIVAFRDHCASVAAGRGATAAATATTLDRIWRVSGGSQRTAGKMIRALCAPDVAHVDASAGLALHSIIAEEALLRQRGSRRVPGSSAPPPLADILVAAFDGSSSGGSADSKEAAAAELLSRYDGSGRTAFHAAIAVGDAPLVQAMLQLLGGETQQKLALCMQITHPRTKQMRPHARALETRVLDASTGRVRQGHTDYHRRTFRWEVAQGAPLAIAAQGPAIAVQVPLQLALVGLRRPEEAVAIAGVLLDVVLPALTAAAARNDNSSNNDKSDKGTQLLAKYATPARMDQLLASCIERKLPAALRDRLLSAFFAASTLAARVNVNSNNNNDHAVAATPSAAIVAAICGRDKQFLSLLARQHRDRVDLAACELAADNDDFSLQPVKGRQLRVHYGRYLGGRGAADPVAYPRVDGKEDDIIAVGRRVMTPVLLCALRGDADLLRFLLAEIAGGSGGAASAATAATLPLEVISKTLRGQDRRELQRIEARYADRSNEVNDEIIAGEMDAVAVNYEHRTRLHAIHLPKAFHEQFDLDRVYAQERVEAVALLSYLARFLSSCGNNEANAWASSSSSSSSPQQQADRVAVLHVLLDAVRDKLMAAAEEKNNAAPPPLYMRVHLLTLFLVSSFAQDHQQQKHDAAAGSLLGKFVSALQLDSAAAAAEFASLSAEQLKWTPPAGGGSDDDSGGGGEDEEDEEDEEERAAKREHPPHVRDLAVCVPPTLLLHLADTLAHSAGALACLPRWFLALLLYSYRHHNVARPKLDERFALSKTALVQLPLWAQTCLAAEHPALIARGLEFGSVTHCPQKRLQRGCGGRLASSSATTTPQATLERRNAFWIAFADALWDADDEEKLCSAQDRLELLLAASQLFANRVSGGSSNSSSASVFEHVLGKIETSAGATTKSGQPLLAAPAKRHSFDITVAERLDRLLASIETPELFKRALLALRPQIVNDMLVHRARAQKDTALVTRRFPTCIARFSYDADVCVTLEALVMAAIDGGGGGKNKFDGAETMRTLRRRLLRNALVRVVTGEPDVALTEEEQQQRRGFMRTIERYAAEACGEPAGKSGEEAEDAPLDPQGSHLSDVFASVAALGAARFDKLYCRSARLMRPVVPTEKELLQQQEQQLNLLQYLYVINDEQTDMLDDVRLLERANTFEIFALRAAARETSDPCAFEERLIADMRALLSAPGSDAGIFVPRRFRDFLFERLLIALCMATRRFDANGAATATSKFCQWLLGDECMELCGALLEKDHGSTMSATATRTTSSSAGDAADGSGAGDDDAYGRVPGLYLFHAVFRACVSTQDQLLLRALADVRRRRTLPEENQQQQPQLYESICSTLFQCRSMALRHRQLVRRVGHDGRIRAVLDWADHKWNTPEGAGTSEEAELVESLNLLDGSSIAEQEKEQPPLPCCFGSCSMRLRGGYALVVDEAVALHGTAFERLVAPTLQSPQLPKDVTLRRDSKLTWHSPSRKWVFARSFLAQEAMLRSALQAETEALIETQQPQQQPRRLIESVVASLPLLSDAQLLRRLAALRDVRDKNSDSDDSGRLKASIDGLFEWIARESLRLSDMEMFKVQYWNSRSTGREQEHEAVSSIAVDRRARPNRFGNALLFLLARLVADPVHALRSAQAPLAQGQHFDAARRCSVQAPAGWDGSNISAEFAHLTLLLVQHLCGNSPTPLALDLAERLLPELRASLRGVGLQYMKRAARAVSDEDDGNGDGAYIDPNSFYMRMHPQCYVPSSYWAYCEREQPRFRRQLLLDSVTGAPLPGMLRGQDTNPSPQFNVYENFLPVHDEEIVRRYAQHHDVRSLTALARAVGHGKNADEFGDLLSLLPMHTSDWPLLTPALLHDYTFSYDQADDAFGHGGDSHRIRQRFLFERHVAEVMRQGQAQVLLRQLEPEATRVLGGSSSSGADATTGAAAAASSSSSSACGAAAAPFASAEQARRYVVENNSQPCYSVAVGVTVDDALACDPRLLHSLSLTHAVQAPPQLFTLASELRWPHLVEHGFTAEEAQAIAHRRTQLRLTKATATTAWTTISFDGPTLTFTVAFNLDLTDATSPSSSSSEQQLDEYRAVPDGSPLQRALRFVQTSKREFAFFAERARLAQWTEMPKFLLEQERGAGARIAVAPVLRDQLVAAAAADQPTQLDYLLHRKPFETRTPKPREPGIWCETLHRFLRFLRDAGRIERRKHQQELRAQHRAQGATAGGGMPGADDDATPAPFPNANGAWDEGVNPFLAAAERHSVKALRFLANSCTSYYSPLQLLGNGLDAPRMVQTLLRAGSGGGSASNDEHVHVAWLWFVAPHLRRYNSFGHEANEAAALREMEAATDVDEATRACARAMLVLSSLHEDEEAAEND